VANLLLARAAAREKEIAIRVSLGATRGHLIRQLLAERALLSIGGGLLGLLVSSWAGSVLLALLPKNLPIQGINADPDSPVLAFAFCVSVITGLLFGSVAAFRATRPDVAPVLKEQSASLGSQGHARFRRALVAGQIAISVLLLAVAGVFAHSLYNLDQLDPGFRSNRLVTFGMNPSLSGYSPDRSLALFADIQRELATVPGVVGASIAQQPLLTGSMDMSSFNIEGYEPTEGDKNVSVNDNEVGRGFFSVMGIPLVAGREFTDMDLLGAPRAAIVNETFVKKYCGSRNPIGLHLTLGGSTMPIEIVGVVRDAKYDDLREKPRPFLYLAAAQDKAVGGMPYYIRTTMPAASLATALRVIIRRRDPNLPAITARQVREQILDSIFLDRLVAVLALAFAMVATLLAAVGLYGVISWSVTRRRREMGIRMALGAHTGDVLRLILREVLWLGVAGVAVAVPIWFAAAKVLESQLYGVTIRDPLRLIASVAILSLVAAAAGFLPALRAAHVDPISAIRYE
jgi:putative ABC transport system permease protein